MESMELEISSKESRSRRSRVMEQSMKSLGERVKAASAEGDSVKARRLLSQLQVRVLKRTRATKRVGFSKKSSSMLDLESHWQHPLPVPPRSCSYQSLQQGHDQYATTSSTGWPPLKFSAGGASERSAAVAASPEATSGEGISDIMDVASASEIVEVEMEIKGDRRRLLSRPR